MHVALVANTGSRISVLTKKGACTGLYTSIWVFVIHLSLFQAGCQQLTCLRSAVTISKLISMEFSDSDAPLNGKQ